MRLILGWVEPGFNCWGSYGASARVILVLSECVWNAPAVSLVFPAFDDTGSLGYLPQWFPPWVIASHFLERNREVELKLTPLSSLLLFR